MKTPAHQPPQSNDPEVIQWLQQFPAEVLEAALLILQQGQSNANG